jgi:hypothetical protein
VVVAIVVCLIRILFQDRGGDENSLLTCQKRFGIAEIVDKIEIYNLAREVLLPRYSRGVFVVEDTVDGGVRGENAFATSYLRRSK